MFEDLQKTAKLAGDLRSFFSPTVLATLREHGRLVFDEETLAMMLRAQMAPSGVLLTRLTIAPSCMVVGLEKPGTAEGTFRIDEVRYEPGRPLGVLSCRVSSVEQASVFGFSLPSWAGDIFLWLTRSIIGDLYLDWASSDGVTREGDKHFVDLGAQVETQPAALAAVGLVTISEIGLCDGAVSVGLEPTPAVRVVLAGWHWLNEKGARTALVSWPETLRAELVSEITEFGASTGASVLLHDVGQACRWIVEKIQQVGGQRGEPHGLHEISSAFATQGADQRHGAIVLVDSFSSAFAKDPEAVFVSRGLLVEHELIVLAEFERDAADAEGVLVDLMPKVEVAVVELEGKRARLMELSSELESKLVPGMHFALQEQVHRVARELESDAASVEALQDQAVAHQEVSDRYRARCHWTDACVQPWLVEYLLTFKGRNEQVNLEIVMLEEQHQKRLDELKSKRATRGRWNPLRLVDLARETGTAWLGTDGEASAIRLQHVEEVCPGFGALTMQERLALVWMLDQSLCV